MTFRSACRLGRHGCDTPVRALAAPGQHALRWPRSRRSAPRADSWQRGRCLGREARRRAGDADRARDQHHPHRRCGCRGPLCDAAAAARCLPSSYRSGRAPSARGGADAAGKPGPAHGRAVGHRRNRRSGCRDGAAHGAQARHARSRDSRRQPAGRQPAARRPQLSRAVAPRAGRISGAGGIGELGARRVRLQRQWRSRRRQRIRPRRCRQRGSQAQYARGDAGGRCHPRVRGAHELIRGAARALQRGAGERGGQVGHQRPPGHRLRLLPPRRARRAQRVRAGGRAGARATVASSSASRRVARSCATGCSSSAATKPRGRSRASRA
jgi:hypothetical protein